MPQFAAALPRPQGLCGFERVHAESKSERTVWATALVQDVREIPQSLLIHRKFIFLLTSMPISIFSACTSSYKE